MTISTTNTRMEYTGNGGVAVYAYDFLITADTELVVIETDNSVSPGVDTVLVLNTNYTVTGAGAPGGGNVTRTAGNLDTGDYWTIYRDTVDTQTTDFTDALNTAAHDKIMKIAQEHTTALSRAIRLPESDHTTDPDTLRDELLDAATTSTASSIAAAASAAAALVSENNAAASESAASGYEAAVAAEGATQVAAVQAEGVTQLAAVNLAGTTGVSNISGQEAISLGALAGKEASAISAVDAQQTTSVNAVLSQQSVSVAAVQSEEVDALALMETVRDETFVYSAGIVTNTYEALATAGQTVIDITGEGWLFPTTAENIRLYVQGEKVRTSDITILTDVTIQVPAMSLNDEIEIVSGVMVDPANEAYVAKTAAEVAQNGAEGALYQIEALLAVSPSPIDWGDVATGWTVQHRRDIEATVDTYTGPAGEIVMVTDVIDLRLMDGVTAGGLTIMTGGAGGILAVADGGTGSGTAAGARTNLGLAIGTDIQAYIQNNYAGAADPTANDDSSAGYSVGSHWYNVSGATNEGWLCSDASVGAAEWNQITVDASDLGTMALQNANAVAITGGTAVLTTLSVTGTGSPAYTLYKTDGALDEKWWDTRITGDTLEFRSINDAGSVVDEWMTVHRTAEDADLVTISPPVILSNTLQVDGLLTLTAGISDNFTVEGSGAQIFLYDTAGTADKRKSYILNDADKTDIRATNDAGTITHNYLSMDHDTGLMTLGGEVTSASNATFANLGLGSGSPQSGSAFNISNTGAGYFDGSGYTVGGSINGAGTHTAAGASNVTMFNVTFGVPDGALSPYSGLNLVVNTAGDAALVSGANGVFLGGHASGKTVTTAVAMAANAIFLSDGTTTDLSLFGVGSLADYGGATITTAHGLQLPDITIGATNFGIKTGLGPNYLGDDLSVVLAADKVGLTVKANGTQTANLMELYDSTGTLASYFDANADTLNIGKSGTGAPVISLRGTQAVKYYSGSLRHMMTSIWGADNKADSSALLNINVGAAYNGIAYRGTSSGTVDLMKVYAYSGGADLFHIDNTPTLVNMAISGDITIGTLGQLILPDATVGAPSLTFTNSPDTGMYSSGSRTIDFATFGIRRMSISAGGATTVFGTIQCAGVGSFSQRFGQSANANGSFSSAYGYAAEANFTGATSVGYDSTATGNYQFVSGSASAPSNDVYFGRGPVSSTPSLWTLRGTTNNDGAGGAGGSLGIQGGAPDSVGGTVYGDLILQPDGGDVTCTGSMLLGAGTQTTNGTIRWSGTDMEARKGGAWVSLTASGSGSVAGADTQIQYNASGVFGAEAGFTYNYTTNTVTVDNVAATFVGVAGGTAAAAFTGADELVVGSGSGDQGLTIYSGATGDGNIYFSDTTTSGSGQYAGFIQFNHTLNSLDIGSTSGIMRINSAGNVTMRFESTGEVNIDHQGALTQTTYALGVQDAGAGALGIYNTSGTKTMHVDGSGWIYADTQLLLSNDNTGYKVVCGGSGTSSGSGGVFWVYGNAWATAANAGNFVLIGGDTASGGDIVLTPGATAGEIVLNNLPTSSGGATGSLWNNSGVININ